MRHIATTTLALAAVAILIGCSGTAPSVPATPVPEPDPPTQEELAEKFISVHHVFPLEEAMAACEGARLIDYVVTYEDGSAEVAYITGEFTTPDDGGEGWTWTYAAHGDGATGTLSVIAADGSIMRYTMAFDGFGGTYEASITDASGAPVCSYGGRFTIYDPPPYFTSDWPRIDPQVGADLEGLATPNVLTQPAIIDFVNHLYEPIQVFWIDFTGRMVLMMTLAARQSDYLYTYVDHLFVVRDATGLTGLVEAKSAGNWRVEIGDPDAQLPPEESLTGSIWIHEDTWSDDDGVFQGPRVHTLVFTSGRLIRDLVHIGADGTFDADASYARSGGWAVTGDNEITITEDSDAGLRNVPLRYEWADDERTGIYLPNLADGRYQETLLYTSRGAPSHDVIGTWFHERELDVQQEDGTTSRERYTYTLEITSATLKYTYTEQAEADYGTDHMGVIEITGSLTRDIFNMHLWQTVTAVEASWTDDYGAQLLGQELRWGYVLWGDHFLISPYWSELMWDEDHGIWTERENSPFGNYTLRMARQ